MTEKRKDWVIFPYKKNLHADCPCHPNLTQGVKKREVSMKLHDVPLSDILTFINKQTHLEYTITSKGVFFTEPSPE